MAKKCNHCGTVVEDKVTPCPKCDNFAFTDLPKAELSHEQFLELEKRVAEKLGKSSRLAWRLTWRIALVIFTILGIPGAIVGWSIWSSLQSFEQTANKDIQTKFAAINSNVSNRIENAHSAISNDVAAKFSVYAQEASNQLAEAHVFVTNQIAAEFQTPRIKQTIESVAKGEAKSILETEVQPAVTSFKEDALFMRTIARAQGYDFKAYQSLLEIKKGTNDNAKLANQVIAETDRTLERNRSDILGKKTFGIIAGTNIYGGPFTSDELALQFSSTAQDRTSLNREGFVNTASDLNSPLFLPSFIEFFTNETDLAVADRLTIAISALAKEDFHPRDFERIQTWWTSHQNEYTNWPTAEFSAGLNSIAVGNWSPGYQSFQKVLEIDPSADKSRALAILCSFGISETNKATELMNGFKQPDGRWAQWAAAFVELQNGSISNATARFANLKKTQPTLPVLPYEASLVWSKIDWQLFQRLTSSEKP